MYMHNVHIYSIYHNTTLLHSIASPIRVKCVQRNNFCYNSVVDSDPSVPYNFFSLQRCEEVLDPDLKLKVYVSGSNQ